MSILRISLARYHGVPPKGAIKVDHFRGWFTIDEKDLPKPPTGPAPTQVSRHPIIVRDPKTLFPCIHRKNHIGDTPCGGCSGRRYVEVFACDLHRECVVNQTPRDGRIKICTSCQDRAATLTRLFASYKNRYAGKVGTIVGRGETTLPNEELAKLDGPMFFINDAVQLERYCPDNPDTFLLAQDQRIAPNLVGMRSTAVLAKGTGLAFHVNHHALVGDLKVVWTIKPDRSEEYLLGLDRDDLEIEQRLYRPARAPTICSAIHFAWYTGVTHLRLIRCDCLPTPYAKDLENKSNSQEVPQQYPQTKLDQEEVMRRLGMTWEYMGTPQDVSPPPRPITVSFTSTETDAPGRAAINREALESIGRNLIGVNLKDCILYLNIDHVPGGVGPEPTLAAVAPYFKKVVVRESGTGDFGAAFKWCIGQGDTDFLLHYELDWILSSQVHLRDLADLLISNDSLTCINLRAYQFRSDDRRICLSPGLWRASHAKTIAERLEPGVNPETQLRPVSTGNPYGGKALGFYGRQYPDNRNIKMIEDIGRDFLKGTKYRRRNNIEFNAYEVIQ